MSGISNGNMATRHPAGEVKLGAVSALVGTARRSRRLQTAVDIVLKSTIVGLGVIALVEAATLVQQHPIAPVLAGTAAFALTLIGLGSLAALRAPSLLATARRLDARLGLDERLSTALEASSLPASPDSGERMLRTALFGDAERAAMGVPPDRATERRSWRHAWLVPALIAVVVALAMIEASRLAPEFSAALPPPAVTDTEREATDVVLRQIADLIEQNKAADTTPVMQALARTVQAVRADLATDELDREELTSALQALASQAAQASRQAAPAIGSRIETALGEQIEALERGPEAAQPLPGESLGAADAKADTSPVSPPSEKLPTSEAAQTTLQSGQAPPPKPTDYFAPDPHALSRQMAERAASEQLNPGVPAGGAKEADRGGNQAGEGVRPLMANLDDLAAQSQSALETMILPENDASAGQRVRVNTMPPDAEAGGPIDSATDQGSWVSGPVEPQNRHSAPRLDLEILKRYFPQSGEF